MITLPVVLIAVAVLLLLALLLGLFLQRRRAARAMPPGPRTVADLVQQRADREPDSAPAPGSDLPEPSTVDEVEVVDEEPEPAAVDGAAVDESDDEPGLDDAAVDDAAVDEPDDEPVVAASVPDPAPVVAARAIAPLGDDVPWRRAAQMSGTDEDEPEATEVGRVPALALLRRPTRRPLPTDDRHPFLSGPRLTAVPVESTEDDSAPAVAGPVAVRSAVAEPGVVEPVAAEKPVDVEPVDVEPVDGELTGGAVAAGEPGDVEPVDGDVAGVEVAGAGPADGEPAGAASAADPLDAASASADGRSVFPLTVAGVVAGGLAVGGAHAAGGRAADNDVPDADVPVGDTAPVETSTPGPAPETDEGSEVVHTDEIDVRGVEAAPNHPHVDLVPVDGGLPAASDRPAAESAPAVAGAAALAGAATVVAATETPSVTEPDVFPSTDPDVLFDSPPVAPEPVSEVADPVSAAPESVDPESVHPEVADPVDAADAVDAPADDAPADEAVAVDAAADSPLAEVVVDEAPAADDTPVAEGTSDDVAASAPAVEAPAADPAAADPPNPAVADVIAPPAGASAAMAPVRAATTSPPTPTTPGTVEPLRRVPRDPEHVAAEQAAADLALLRTFGDPAARPERAPIVALEGPTRPESPPPVGAAQPVRYRAVHRDGTAVSGAAVALLDDRGREVGAGRSATGGLTAPHPGAYVLVATAPDHQPGAVALAVGDAPADVEVLLVRSAALVGVVTGEDGPLAGARVTLVQDGEVVEVAETDADGAYLVADLAAGEYAVSVASAGCDADVVLVLVPDETECVHDVELEPAGVPAG